MIWICNQKQFICSYCWFRQNYLTGYRIRKKLNLFVVVASRGQPIFFILIKIENIDICLVTNRVRLQKDYSPVVCWLDLPHLSPKSKDVSLETRKNSPYRRKKNDEQCLIEYTFLYCQISNKHTQWNKFKCLKVCVPCQIV